MPFYEYECKACKYYTEVMQKITDAPLSKCPSCGKRALKKLVSAPVFRLKGAGWYETDFKSDKENKRNLLGSEKDEPKPETKAEAKDAKPAVKDGQDGKGVKEVKDVKDSAPAKDKAAGPKAAGAATRRSVSVAARGGAAGRRAGRAAAKSARKRRR
jgi:putative FmdB family regulatory protein